MTDFEGAIEGAWRGFRVALGDALAALEESGRLHISIDSETDVDGLPPFAGINLVDGQLLIALAGNEWLSEGQRLRKPARRRLRELGFQAPDGGFPNYWISLAQRDADRAADLLVSALRESYGVAHPAFLIGNVDGLREASATRAPSEDPRGVALPQSREEIDALIGAALVPILGQEPVRDEDGDIGIRLGTTFMFIRTREDDPLAEFVAQVVTQVADSGEALEAVNELNRQVDGARFVVTGEFIYARQDVVVAPFVAEAFRVTLARFCQVVAGCDTELAARVRGEVFLPDSDDAEHAEEIHPVMVQLLQLDAEQPGSLKPKQVARICDHDADLITELIMWNEEQEMAWAQARDEAQHDPGEREMCEHERAHAEMTLRLLRRTLRRVLLR